MGFIRKRKPGVVKNTTKEEGKTACRMQKAFTIYICDEGLVPEYIKNAYNSTAKRQCHLKTHKGSEQTSSHNIQTVSKCMRRSSIGHSSLLFSR